MRIADDAPSSLATAGRGWSGVVRPPDDNLALRPGVQVEVVPVRPTGPGARDPRVLLNERVSRLDGCQLAELDQALTYDTYDGPNLATGPDWYALRFPEPTPLNCLELTMGFPYRDGGWWTSLAVEFAADDPGTIWLPVANLRIAPPYDFADARGERRPFATYALTFDEVTTRAIRVIGQPGGTAGFTSIMRLAVFLRDLSRWNPTDLPGPPVPRVFQLIAPSTVWDLSESLVKLTGLAISIPYMAYYLDESRFQQFWRRSLRGVEDEPELWLLVGNAIGWDTWRRLNSPPGGPERPSPVAPYLRRGLHGTLGSAVAPIVVEGQVLAEMTTRPAVLADGFDLAWHQAYAATQFIPWADYQAALARSPRMTIEQLEGAAALMGMIANTIANLVHHLDHARTAAAPTGQGRHEIVRRAIDFMEEHLEAPIGVGDVARAVGLNPSYFCTRFTAQTGRNPSEMLIDLRIARAKEYLAHSPMSVMDVCVALGYSPSYFNRLFKQRTGLTPGHYAALQRARS